MKKVSRTPTYSVNVVGLGFVLGAGLGITFGAIVADIKLDVDRRITGLT